MLQKIKKLKERFIFWLCKDPMEIVIKNYLYMSETDGYCHMYKDKKNRYWLAFSRYSLNRREVFDGEKTVNNIKDVKKDLEKFSKIANESGQEELIKANYFISSCETVQCEVAEKSEV